MIFRAGIELGCKKNVIFTFKQFVVTLNESNSNNNEMRDVNSFTAEVRT